ncbi:hypothetical protein [Phyllobacterium zundukense]|uniref:Uncharacterized protein n=1 Tax=Phyllobacterium zundukense TaxID=1867719 RepID=A0ACD4D7A1_9HYPH|nr:hypothetical protein [Phyllobacterium zundukense]UXN61722.1 hypothetical protein N8E88_16890 [Phyllobacterium zundukense]
MNPDTIITFDGTSQSVTEWALDFGITPEIIIARLQKGWDAEQAITRPMFAIKGQILNGSYIRRYLNPRRTLTTTIKVTTKPKAKPASIYEGAKPYSLDGRTLTLAQWSKVTGIKVKTLQARLDRGWSNQQTFETPLRGITDRLRVSRKNIAKLYECDGRALSLRQWSVVTGIPHQTLYARLSYGWSIERAIHEPQHRHNPSRVLASNDNTPGVVSNFTPSQGTGAGSTLQETPEITFSETTPRKAIL